MGRLRFERHPANAVYKNNISQAPCERLHFPVKASFSVLIRHVKAEKHNGRLARFLLDDRLHVVTDEHQRRGTNAASLNEFCEVSFLGR